MSASILLLLLYVCVSPSWVSSQSLSLSLTTQTLNETSQLFCYSLPPPADPVRCVLTQQNIALKSFALVNRDAPPIDATDTSLYVYPRPLTFVNVSGNAVTLQTNALVVLPLFQIDTFHNTDVWVSGDAGKTYVAVNSAVGVRSGSDD